MSGVCVGLSCVVLFVAGRRAAGPGPLVYNLCTVLYLASFRRGSCLVARGRRLFVRVTFDPLVSRFIDYPISAPPTPRVRSRRVRRVGPGHGVC